MLKGIDISHHQRNIDLSKIETDFVICKATEGNGYTDECCDKFYQQAKKLGKKLGIYHFARPDLGNTAIAEADWFLKETKGYHNEAILVLDWEARALNYPISWAKEWMDRVYEKTGIKPILYISESPANSKDWSSVANADYGIWVAKYSSKAPSLKHWKFYCMWQYTSKGSLQGYSGNLDLDYFYGDSIAWDKYASKSGDNISTQTEPVKKTNEEIANEIINDKDNVKWGTTDTNPTRKQRLESAGYDYNAVQTIVNQKLKVNKATTSAIYHIVKKGEILSKIASRYGTTANKIASLNSSIKDINKIYAGQKIRVK